ncbi:MAG TPA: hypothetical protein VFZ21_29440 [Gemmatimonadaceae bacterium]|jgi:hypothetical protein|nr:hypothetical protein [Gemmatimonadaceae bacterium]
MPLGPDKPPHNELIGFEDVHDNAILERVRFVGSPLFARASGSAVATITAALLVDFPSRRGG